jgi:hypothetical protein
MKKKVYASLGVLALPLLVVAITMPSGWNKELLGLHRSQVHQRIGMPSVDRFELKGTEEWKRPVIFGTWVVCVGYGTGAPEKVSNVDRADRVFHLGGNTRYLPIKAGQWRQPEQSLQVP